MSTLNLGDSLILNSDIVMGTEIKTGMTWGGKPVYAYGFQMTLTNDSGWTYINHGISNMYDVIFMYSNYITLTPVYVQICSGSPTTQTAMSVSRTQIGVYNNTTEAKNRPVRGFIMYTKTTD